MNETTTPPNDTIVLRRIDPARNMARYYALTLEPTLFGEIAVMRHWGRIGTRGRSKSCFLGPMEAARTALRRQAERKRRRGYGTADLPSFPDLPEPLSP
jgi:predicted DNA-binding WGR domain protein